MQSKDYSYSEVEIFSMISGSIWRTMTDVPITFVFKAISIFTKAEIRHNETHKWIEISYKSTDDSRNYFVLLTFDKHGSNINVFIITIEILEIANELILLQENEISLSKQQIIALNTWETQKIKTCTLAEWAVSNLCPCPTNCVPITILSQIERKNYFFFKFKWILFDYVRLQH